MNAIPEEHPSSPEQGDPAKRKILIVDDNPGIRKMLTCLLADEDYTVASATNGTEGLELAQNMKPDLVLLDLKMPGKDGWDTYAQLISKSPELPVIVITGRKYQFMPAIFSGVGALMEKPLDLLTLLKTVRELLEESVESRLAWLKGKPAKFHFVPSKA